MEKIYNYGQVQVKYDSNVFSTEEIESYLATLSERFPNLLAVTFKQDGEKVAVEYKQLVPFERIRRITGYLTGDLNTWNNAKRAEERDRVKHEVTDYES